MKNFINKIGSKMNCYFTMSPEERFLASSTDLADLENRQRMLQRGHGPATTGRIYIRS